MLLSELISIRCYAQTSFDKSDSISVTVESGLAKFPWSGGFNFCQFSSIDLNDDDIKDLFVFDKSGNRISAFINYGASNNIDYKYAPEYVSKFPSLSSWALLVDYNCDGREDVFTSTTGGIKVYKNISDSSDLKFQLQTGLLMSQYNSLLNLYVSPTDIPAIIDVDNDTDLDIITFGIQGNFVEWHRNMSKEFYGNCDSLTYQVESYCWGNFEENNASGQIAFNVSCKGGTGSSGGLRHAGSTLLALDMDGDLDKDLIVGDVSSNQLLFLNNGGDLNNAAMVSEDSNFPSNTTAANLFTFPAAFFLDVDNDDKKDLIVSPNAPNVSENFESIYYYKNFGTSEAPLFTFQKKNFFQDETIDVGEGAYPVLYDIDNDGKKDLFIGNYGYFDNTSGIYKSKIAHFKNTGTNAQPQYDLVTRDFAGIESQNGINVFPAFGDLDGDGDADMIVGEQDGLIHFFENQGIAAGVINYVLTGPSYFNIDVGQAATPLLIDINRDGKLDLVIGEKNGSLNYAENTGTLTNPVFDTLIETWGGVDVRTQGFTVGYSVPFVYEENGKYKLLVGSENGRLYLYDNIENNAGGLFNLVNSSFGNISEGIRTAPAGADLNNDGLIDLIVGNYAGGLGLYYGNNKVSINQGSFSRIEFEIFPNPATQNLLIKFSDSAFDYYELSIVNLIGETLIREKITSPDEIILIEQIPPGMYLVEISNDFGHAVKKLVKQ